MKTGREIKRKEGYGRKTERNRRGRETKRKKDEGK